MERGFQSLCPKIAPGPVVLKFVKSGEVSGVVLLQIEIGSLEHMDFTCFLLELLFSSNLVCCIQSWISPISDLNCFSIDLGVFEYNILQHNLVVANAVLPKANLSCWVPQHPPSPGDLETALLKVPMI